jgi:hypothetical protein
MAADSVFPRPRIADRVGEATGIGAGSINDGMAEDPEPAARALAADNQKFVPLIGGIALSDGAACVVNNGVI